ncbi:hypothetical protein N8089_02335 [Flavobacteriales bacterium]|nr:hypothetical protein [Flavobacteriales bacterium]
MIWTFVIIVVGIIAVKFFISFNKDNDDLQGKKLDEKFGVIVNMINEAAFDGQGSITTFSKREFNLYRNGENQIINFSYGTGHLTINWKYKYFQKEIVHEKQFTDVRNLSLFEQEKIGRQIISEMTIIVEKHKNNVLDI